MIPTCKELSCFPDHWITVVSQLIILINLLTVFIDSDCISPASTCLLPGSCIISLFSLCFSILECFIFNDVFSSLELFLDFCCCYGLTFHPWMGKQLFEVKSMFWVKTHHLFKQILKFRRENVCSILNVGMSPPENICSISCK